MFPGRAEGAKKEDRFRVGNLTETGAGGGTPAPVFQCGRSPLSDCPFRSERSSERSFDSQCGEGKPLRGLVANATRLPERLGRPHGGWYNILVTRSPWRANPSSMGAAPTWQVCRRGGLARLAHPERQ